MDSGGCVLFEIKRISDKPVARTDPAPSRFKYGLHRFWMRKSYRLLVIFFIPAIIGFLSVFIISKTYNINILLKENTKKFFELVAYSPAFKVVNLRIISDDPAVVEKIKTNVDLNFPLSSLDINVGTLKEQIEKIKLVRSANVRMTSDGSIEVEVEKREPIAIQRISNEFLLLDASGFEVDKISSRSQRPDLPLLVGIGADQQVGQALRLLLETKNLITRVRGLVRIGDRRWDIILDRNQVIKLPEKEPIKALKKIISLHEGRRLLDRDVIYIDFRNMDRPVLGLTDETSEELRTSRSLVRGEAV